MTDRGARGGQSGTGHERQLRRSWLSFVGCFVALVALLGVRLAFGQREPLDIALAALVVGVGLASVFHRRAIAGIEASRRLESESFARILQGLSRSVSPDAIVNAIVEDLGVATGADHTVVVRLRADASILEATLVSSRAGVPSSTTMLPLSDLDDPGETPTPRRGLRAAIAVNVDPDGVPAARVAQRLAERVGAVYGLKNTLAAPLVTAQGVVGAIVLSHRTNQPWTDAAARFVDGAAVEASAALARAYNHRAQEAAASTDALTGLPNRRYFEEFCSLLAQRRRADDAIGVLMIDIDHFKSLNDTFGHPVGDQVLRGVATAIAAAVREGDVPARYGGEEFAVLLRNPGPVVAAEVGERVRSSVEGLDLSAFGPASVTVSIGVAVARTGDQPIAELVQEADQALYRAKRAGRNQVVAA